MDRDAELKLLEELARLPNDLGSRTMTLIKSYVRMTTAGRLKKGYSWAEAWIDQVRPPPKEIADKIAQQGTECHSVTRTHCPMTGSKTSSERSWILGRSSSSNNTDQFDTSHWIHATQEELGQTGDFVGPNRSSDSSVRIGSLESTDRIESSGDSTRHSGHQDLPIQCKILLKDIFTISKKPVNEFNRPQVHSVATQTENFLKAIQTAPYTLPQSEGIGNSNADERCFKCTRDCPNVGRINANTINHGSAERTQTGGRPLLPRPFPIQREFGTYAIENIAPSQQQDPRLSQWRASEDLSLNRYTPDLTRNQGSTNPRTDRELFSSPDTETFNNVMILQRKEKEQRIRLKKL